MKKICGGYACTLADKQDEVPQMAHKFSEAYR